MGGVGARAITCCRIAQLDVVSKKKGSHSIVVMAAGELAERVGFEPTKPCDLRALQARLFNHSSTSPSIVNNLERLEGPLQMLIHKLPQA